MVGHALEIHMSALGILCALKCNVYTGLLVIIHVLVCGLMLWW